MNIIFLLEGHIQFYLVEIDESYRTALIEVRLVDKDSSEILAVLGKYALSVSDTFTVSGIHLKTTARVEDK